MNAPDAIRCAGFLLATFVAVGCLHTWWLKSSWSKRLAFPIDCGITFRGRRLFGENKMVRGFALLIPATAVAFAVLSRLVQGPWQLSASQYAALGAWAGFGFMLGELPNSFMKRQLDIAPGGVPENLLAKCLCLLLDRTDSILGMLIALQFFVTVPLMTWLVVLTVGVAIHGSFSVALYRLGIKARPL